MKTILVIDDGKYMRKLLCEVFVMEGYNVLTAETARIGYSMMDHADLILSDVNTGGLFDGNDLCQEIKFAYPNFPVILMSSLSNFAPEADYTFNKGSELTELIDKVNELLEE